MSSGPRGRLAALAGRLGGAVVAQGVVAGSSLGLQVVALRVLGTAEFGLFALLVAGVLSLAAGLHSSLVGDTLTVLDRRDPGVRAALRRLVVVGAPLPAAVLAAAVLGLGYVDVVGAAVFALLVLTWLLEEVLRRVLAARREYWRLVAVDTTYATVAVGGAVVLGLTGDASVVSLLAVMTAGCVVAAVVALVLLPREEYVPGPPARPAMRPVLAFGSWRAAQTSLRPAALLALRVAVEASAGRVALGLLEAARLFAAAGLVLVNGIGTFLLPTFTRLRDRVREGRVEVRPALRTADGAAGALVGATAVLGVVATAAAPFVDQALLDVEVDVVAVAGWSAYVCSTAAIMPYALLLAALERARAVTRVQAVALGTATAAACATVLVSEDLVAWSPAVLALGAVPAALLLRRACGRRLAEVHRRDADDGSAADGPPAEGVAPRIG